MPVVRRPNIGRHPLVEYEWDPETGASRRTYLTRDASTGEPGPDLEVYRHEPTRPGHDEWSRLWARETPVRERLSLVGERVEAMVEGLDDDYRWQYL